MSSLFVVKRRSSRSNRGGCSRSRVVIVMVVRAIFKEGRERTRGE